MAAKKKRKYFYDYSLLFAVIFITGFGMIMMYSASGIRRCSRPAAS